MGIENKHSIPQEIWNSFTAEGKLRFNNIMDKTKNNQRAFLHPMAFEMEEHHWRALTYNIACIAVWNEFDLNYKPEEIDAMFSAKDKLLQIPIHYDQPGNDYDAELV